MPLNLGYMELGSPGDVLIRIYYDSTFTPVGPDQPLIDGPRGYCLDISNASGKNLKVTVNGLADTPMVVNIGRGDPVTNGPGRSRTLAEMNAAGFTTRGDVGAVSLE